MEFFRDPKWAKIQLILAIAMVVIGGASLLLIGSGGAPFGLGVFFIILHFGFGHRPLVTLYEDYMEMKLAPAAPKHLIRYSEIAEIVEEKKKKVHMRVSRSSGEKKIYLPMAALTPESGKKLLSELRSRATI